MRSASPRTRFSAAIAAIALASAGLVAGLSTGASHAVEYKDPTELLTNGGFEEYSENHWTIDYTTGGPNEGTNGIRTNNPKEGLYGYNLWSPDSATEVRLTQTVQGRPGKYTLTGWANGNDGDGVIKLFVSGGKTQEVEIPRTTPHSWQEGRITFELDKAAELTVGFHAKMNKVRGWSALDALSLQFEERIFKPTALNVRGESPKTVYRPGESFDIGSLGLKATLEDGSEVPVDPSEVTVEGFNSDTEGERTVTLTLTDHPTISTTMTVNVTVEDADRVASLRMLEPTRDPKESDVIRVPQGSPLGERLSGMSTDGNERLLAPSEYTVSGFDPNTLGRQAVTFTMKAEPKASMTVNVEVVAPEAASESSCTINRLDSSAGDKVTVEGTTVTVNLDACGENANVVIGKRALPEGVTSVVFAGGEKAASLTLEPFALASEKGNPSLASVTFPAVARVNIGDSALFQYSARGSAALKDVTFPCGIRHLTIGDHAFKQDVRESTTLANVVFPDNLETLEVGPYAFTQKAGKAIALSRMSIPSGLASLKLLDKSFYVTPMLARVDVAAPRTVHFRIDDPSGAPREAVIAADALGNGTRHANAPVTWTSGVESTTLGRLIPGMTGDDAAKAFEVTRAEGVADEGRCVATMIYDLNKDDAGEAPAAVTGAPYDSFDVANLESDPTFRRWNTAADGTGMDYVPGTSRLILPGETTLYAIYEETDNSDGDGDGTVDPDPEPDPEPEPVDPGNPDPKPEPSNGPTADPVDPKPGTPGTDPKPGDQGKPGDDASHPATVTPSSDPSGKPADPKKASATTSKLASTGTNLLSIMVPSLLLAAVGAALTLRKEVTK